MLIKTPSNILKLHQIGKNFKSLIILIVDEDVGKQVLLYTAVRSLCWNYLRRKQGSIHFFFKVHSLSAA